ncbi:uncharacterized protein LOC124775699 [Schistocerca piceifrons]|uniref:uncharacterized protein LOC124775699 n=1 Tax=Schistocerca piceifrons TaxID=274613 RepID=UPI001F5F7F8D|nr:uncharacterized protein LOC124775699 [Schistocerca piceifrons]
MDLAVGGLQMSSALDLPLELTTPHVSDSLLWFVPLSPRTHWETIVTAIVPATALASSALIILSFCAGAILPFRHRVCTKWATQWFFPLFAALILVPVRQPRSCSARVLFIFWVLFSMLIQTVIQSAMTSYVTHPSYPQSIHSEEELAASGMTCATVDQAASFYRKVKRANSPEITKTCSPYLECIHRLLCERDIAMLASELNFRYTSGADMKIGARYAFAPLPIAVNSAYRMVAFAKHRLLASLVNHKIQQVIEGDLISATMRRQMQKDRQDYTWCPTAFIKDSGSQAKILVFMAFRFQYLIMVACSLIVFAAELLHAKVSTVILRHRLKAHRHRRQ